MVDEGTGPDDSYVEPVVLTREQAFEAKRKALYELQKEKARAYRKEQSSKLKAARKESRKAAKVSANEQKRAAMAERDRTLRGAIIPAAKLEAKPEAKLRLVKGDE